MITPMTGVEPEGGHTRETTPPEGGAASIRDTECLHTQQPKTALIWVVDQLNVAYQLTASVSVTNPAAAWCVLQP